MAVKVIVLHSLLSVMSWPSEPNGLGALKSLFKKKGIPSVLGPFG